MFDILHCTACVFLTQPDPFKNHQTLTTYIIQQGNQQCVSLFPCFVIIINKLDHIY